MLIGTAIYELLNKENVTDLCSVYYGIAEQTDAGKYLVIEESGQPENFKNGYSIVIHDLEISIYCPKTKSGAGGFMDCNAIAEQVELNLNRYSGVAGGKTIQTITKYSQEVLFDDQSQKALLRLGFTVREQKSDPTPTPSTGIGYMQIGSTFIVS